MISNPEAAQLARKHIYSNPPYSLLQQFISKIKPDDKWQFYEINPGHDAMIVAPEPLSRLLLQFAKASA